MGTLVIIVGKIYEPFLLVETEQGESKMPAHTKQKKMKKTKGYAKGGMKTKGYARGGMKTKGYSMGGMKGTSMKRKNTGMDEKKPVPKGSGLSKLPRQVRNKMGFMKNGGMVKKTKGYAKGGMKTKGYARGGKAKK